MATETGEGTAESETEADATPPAETDDDASTGSGEDTSTGSGQGFSQHARSITVTTTATMLGVLTGVVSTLVATQDGSPDSMLGFLLVVGAVVVQLPFYSIIGIDTDSFETKDQLYIFAMTFILWFVTWSIFLTTGALQ
jgi:hypothetical protein